MSTFGGRIDSQAVGMQHQRESWYPVGYNIVSLPRNSTRIVARVVRLSALPRGHFVSAALRAAILDLTDLSLVKSMALRTPRASEI